MRHRKHPNNFDITRVIKKFFLSAFVVVSFILYALNKPYSSVTGKLSSSVAQAGAQNTAASSPSSQDPAAANTTAPSQGDNQTSGIATSPDVPPTTIPPTPVPPTSVASSSNNSGQTGLYKNGTYTGPEEDAQYGLVQVQAVIQNGKVTSVQALEYPTDRRTSAYINSIAVPDLQQESMQAQSANIDLITGATLTSMAFAASLQAALSQAQGQ